MDSREGIELIERTLASGKRIETAVTVGDMLDELLGRLAENKTVAELIELALCGDRLPDSGYDPCKLTVDQGCSNRPESPPNGLWQHLADRIRDCNKLLRLEARSLQRSLATISPDEAKKGMSMKQAEQQTSFGR